LAEGPRSAFTEAIHNYLIHAGSAKLSAYLYISTEVKDVVNARDALVHELTTDVKVLLATADAWCKMVAKAAASGLAKTVAAQKETAVMIVDETQSYQLAAVTAACHLARSVVFLGDENQVIDMVQPNYRRTPRVSPGTCEGQEKTTRHLRKASYQNTRTPFGPWINMVAGRPDLSKAAGYAEVPQKERARVARAADATHHTSRREAREEKARDTTQKKSTRPLPGQAKERAKEKARERPRRRAKENRNYHKMVKVWPH